MSLLEIERSGNSGVVVTKSPTESDRLRGELDAGAAMDQGDKDEIPRVESTNGAEFDFLSWFRATLTSRLYVLTKNHMK